MVLELDKRIAHELRERYRSLEGEGKFLSDKQLTEYYNTFRSRFGPDRLKNLDGEALLNLMHDIGNKDSLVYWLEFKDDEEFPSTRFGSIAGGSAFKFGLFRKKETGTWTSGAPNNPVKLSVEQAVEIAKRHRDQLIRGVEVLERMPENGTDADYNNLQQQMNRVAPDVSNLAWGHKYFSLLYPEKLDDFHNPDYQRFHLIKLLQLPPQGEGRYLVAGRYVAIARELNLSINNLTTLLNRRDGNPYSYWRIGTRSYPDKRDFWDMMRDTNCVAIGWSDVGDLSTVTNDRAGKESIRQALLSRDPQINPASVGKAAQQIFHFRWTIATDDLVLASNGGTVLGVGRVTGGYTYDPSGDFPHRRPVEWLSVEPWQQPDQQPDIEGKLTTVFKLRKDKNLLEAEKLIYGTPPVNQPVVSPTPPLPRLEGIPAHIQAILERKGQVILYGPPGTGKTYWAEYTARELAARASFGVTFEQLNVEQCNTIIGNNGTHGPKVRLCCFHPAYGYEDFLEGFRPVSANGQIQFKRRGGIFKKICKDARELPGEKFYLIIDEINRGEIPRIFGELLTVLEKDKRDKSILLPLSRKPFHVPQNVYIIGTMNTADRSIALLDTALRRRFGFVELMPNYETLKRAVAGSIPLGPWLESLNRRIRTYVGRDARNLQIGHAYLLENGRPITDFVAFARVVEDDILPLLEEYCYEDYSILEKILGPRLVDVKNQQINYDLFTTSQQDNLTTALLATDPDIMTTTQAIAAEEQASNEQVAESDDDIANGNEDV